MLIAVLGQRRRSGRYCLRIRTLVKNFRNLMSMISRMRSIKMLGISKDSSMRFRVVETTWKKATTSLLKELRGRIFHVTSPGAFIGICAEGAIMSNENDRFNFNYTSNYYFKNQGCLSVVDLLNNTRPRVTKRKLINDYSIFEQASPVVVFMFLSESVYPRVLTWKKYKQDRAYGQEIVPELESGVPERVALSEIEEVWFITLTDRVALAKIAETYKEIYKQSHHRSRESRASA